MTEIVGRYVLKITHDGLVGVDPVDDSLESVLLLPLPHVGVDIPHKELNVSVLNTMVAYLDPGKGSDPVFPKC